MVVRKLLEFREFIPCFVQPMTMTARNKVYKGQHIAQQTTQANMAMPMEGRCMTKLQTDFRIKERNQRSIKDSIGMTTNSRKFDCQ